VQGGCPRNPPFNLMCWKDLAPAPGPMPPVRRDPAWDWGDLRWRLGATGQAGNSGEQPALTLGE
jgi:hypothetical protein